MWMPSRPSSAPSKRPRGRSELATLSNRDSRSPEKSREELMLLKKQLNDMSLDLVQAQAANARLEQQNALLSRQVDTLLRQGGAETAAVAGIRRQHERSLVAKRLKEQLDGAKNGLRERDALIAELRRSHRHSVVLELEAAKEEYFDEVSRLKRALAAASERSSEKKKTPIRPPPPRKRKAKRPTTKRSDELLVVDDGDSQDSGSGAAVERDSLRALYDEARQAAIDGVAACDFEPCENRAVYRPDLNADDLDDILDDRPPPADDWRIIAAVARIGRVAQNRIRCRVAMLELQARRRACATIGRACRNSLDCLPAKRELRKRRVRFNLEHEVSKTANPDKKPETTPDLPREETREAETGSDVDYGDDFSD